MANKNSLEELLALRAKSDSVDDLAASIDAVAEARNRFASAAASIRANRKNSLLDLSADRLLSLDREAAELDIAVAQAAEILSSLNARLVDRRKSDTMSALVQRRAEYEARSADFSKRFHKLYAPFVEQFCLLMEEIKEIEHAGHELNRDFAIYRETLIFTKEDGHKHFPSPTEIESVETFPVCVAYRDRVVLPLPMLTHEQAGWTPLSYKGCWWKPTYFEGMRPPSVEELKENERRIAEGRADYMRHVEEIRRTNNRSLNDFRPGNYVSVGIGEHTLIDIHAENERLRSE